MHEDRDQISLKLGDPEYGKTVLKWCFRYCKFLMLLPKHFEDMKLETEADHWMTGSNILLKDTFIFKSSLWKNEARSIDFLKHYQ